MTWYARVVDGTVAEPAVNIPNNDSPSKYFPPTLEGSWVECADGNPQSGWVFTAPNTFTAPTITLTDQQKAQIAFQDFLASGITITSTGTPELDGVYAIDVNSQNDIAREAQFISIFSEFTNGTTSDLLWPLMNETLVTFPTTAEFLNFAKAVAQTVAAARLALMQSGTMPSSEVTIP